MTRPSRLAVPHVDITDRILRAFFTAHSRLGHGFAESLYERALDIELVKLGLPFERQVPIRAMYDGQLIGEYRADRIVSGCVLVEVKAVPKLVDAHRGQVVNYLRVAELPVGLLLNFGPSAEVRRVVL